MENCFAYNKIKKECTCLTDSNCDGFKSCVFYKPTSIARAEIAKSKLGDGEYTHVIADVISMIDDNQKEA